VKIESTAWFPLHDYEPVRHGWYEVQLASGEAAFAKFSAEGWTEKPVLIFTHWRGLAVDPATADGEENINAEATAAEGVRAVWDAFFPGLEPDQRELPDTGRSRG
jgi:hypothetical protein